jgi:hypothetical protein
MVAVVWLVAGKVEPCTNCGLHPLRPPAFFKPPFLHAPELPGDTVGALEEGPPEDAHVLVLDHAVRPAAVQLRHQALHLRTGGARRVEGWGPGGVRRGASKGAALWGASRTAGGQGMGQASRLHMNHPRHPPGPPAGPTMASCTRSLSPSCSAIFLSAPRSLSTAASPPACAMAASSRPSPPAHNGAGGMAQACLVGRWESHGQHCTQRAGALCTARGGRGQGMSFMG